MRYPVHDRFRVRRHMAVAAFVTLVLTVPGTFALILVGGEHMGDKLLQGSGVLAPVIACLTALVWKYFGDVTRTDLEEMRSRLPEETTRPRRRDTRDRPDLYSEAGARYPAHPHPEDTHDVEPTDLRDRA